MCSTLAITTIEERERDKEKIPKGIGSESKIFSEKAISTLIKTKHFEEPAAKNDGQAPR